MLCVLRPCSRDEKCVFVSAFYQRFNVSLSKEPKGGEDKNALGRRKENSSVLSNFPIKVEGEMKAICRQLQSPPQIQVQVSGRG